MAQCRKILPNGKRCKAHALKGQKYCMFHSKKAFSFRGSRKGRTNRKLSRKKSRY